MNVPSLPKPSTNRSKRLRKKLRIDEFQLMGLRVEFHFDPNLPAAQTDELIFSFFDFFQLLDLGGCGVSSKSQTEQFLLRYRLGSENPLSVRPEDKAKIEQWLDEQSLVLHYCTYLEDATYDTRW